MPLWPGTAGAEGGESIPQMVTQGLLSTRPYRTGRGWVRGGLRGGGIARELGARLNLAAKGALERGDCGGMLWLPGRGSPKHILEKCPKTAWEERPPHPPTPA